MNSPFTPSPELIEAVEAEWRALGPIWRRLSPADAQILIRAAITVIARELGEEAAKVADKFEQQRLECSRLAEPDLLHSRAYEYAADAAQDIAAALRAHFDSPDRR